MEMPNSVQDSIEEIREFELKLGLTSGFFEALLKEDDWSFIIKLHSLIEASATALLINALNKPELEKQISHIPLSDSSYGKLSLLKSLGLVEKPHESFIRKLSEIRNQAVHNISNTTLNLSEHVNLPEKGQRHALVNAFGAGVKADVAQKEKLLIEDPKLLIWTTAMVLIRKMSLHGKILATDQDIVNLALNALDWFATDKDPNKSM